MESSTKKYGLMVPKKKLGVTKAINVFGDDSDSENEVKNKPIQTENRTKAQQRSAKLLINKALEEDATVFQYDEVYDDIERKKENSDEKKKKVDKKPRYIQNLLVQAEKRKVEYERRNERIIQKEREQEGDEFKDKESYVTSSYKKKLEELKKMDEEDLKLSMIEDINDVTKQKDMGSFYRHLYKAELCKSESDNKMDEVKKPIKKTDANRQYRKRASSNSSDNNDHDDDRDTDISDDSTSSEDLPKQTKRIKTDSHIQREFEDGEIIDEPDVKLKINNPEKSKVDIEKSLNVEVDKLKETIIETENKEIVKNKSEPKVTIPKINIWEKRTVGDIYETARQRYFERKMKNINLRARS